MLVPLMAVFAAMEGISFKEYHQDLSEGLTLSRFYPNTEVPFTINADQYVEQVFKSLVSGQGGTPQKLSGNIYQGLLTNVKKDTSYYRKAVVAAELNNATYTGLYNPYALHSLPITLNILSNTILRRTHPTSSIVVISHPLSLKTDTSYSKFQDNKCTYGFNLEEILKAIPWLLVALGISLAVSQVLLLPVLERASAAKQLQLMASLSPVLYWMAHFLVDFLLYCVSILVAWLAVWLLDKDQELVASGKMYILYFLLLLYGINGIPLAYLVSFFAKSSPKAMMLFFIFNIITGIIPSFLTFGIQAETLTGEFGFIYDMISVLLCFNPLCPLTAALVRLIAVMYAESRCLKCSVHFCNVPDLFEPLSVSNLWSIRHFIGFLMVEWMFFWGILFVIELGLLKRGWTKVSTLWIGPITEHTTLEDEDVSRERERIESPYNASVLQVYDLGKKYNRRLIAVQGTSFMVKKGECFGLLGVNGAGKTTIFKMLTGEETPSIGTASIVQYDLIKERKKYLQKVGYCPQCNVMIDVLTGEEMLRLFAALRGISQINAEVSKWIQLLGLEECSKVQCGKYSGGNKRKLINAMALIGDPPVVFLDEPTAGVDPASRCKLWNVLSLCQKKGQAIILTSQSMEECEALCSRITIMVAGHMKCIGSTQHLKQRFGQGYTIMIKLSPVCLKSDTALVTLKAAMTKVFRNCNIKDEHKRLLHYHLADNSIPLSVLFGHMEAMLKDHPLVEDYTVGDTTLEQVFMSFARQGSSAI